MVDRRRSLKGIVGIGLIVVGIVLVGNSIIDVCLAEPGGE